MAMWLRKKYRLRFAHRNLIKSMRRVDADEWRSVTQKIVDGTFLKYTITRHRFFVSMNE